MAILKGHGYLFSYNFQTPMERWMHHFYSSEKREWFRLLGKTFRIIWPSKVKDNCGKSRFYPIFSHKSRRQIIVDPRSWHNIGIEIKNAISPVLSKWDKKLVCDGEYGYQVFVVRGEGDEPGRRRDERHRRAGDHHRRVASLHVPVHQVAGLK